MSKTQSAPESETAAVTPDPAHPALVKERYTYALYHQPPTIDATPIKGYESMKLQVELEKSATLRAHRDAARVAGAIAGSLKVTGHIYYRVFVTRSGVAEDGVTWTVSSLVGGGSVEVVA